MTSARASSDPVTIQSPPFDQLLTSGEVERILGVSPGWCAKDRIGSARIPYVKIGKCCRYRLVDVNAFIESSMRASTSTKAA